ncbi:hypothetical protein RQP46_002360 [Phenoliferia psychrophenolica]
MPTPAHTLLVGGVDVALASRETFAVLNPLTGSPVSHWPNATLADCNAAVEGCHLAQPAWERVLPAQKRAILLLAADLVQSARYESRIKEAMESETSAHANWISPILLAFRAVAIPLICGNGVVLKCSEFSPECGRIVVDILLEAGVPRTVLAYLTFDRAAAPTLTAALIAQKTIKRVCMSSERIFVEESASAAFVEELTVIATTWMSSHSSKVSSEPIPPVLNPASATRLRALVALAVEQGATDLLADASTSPSGSIVRPSILINVTPSMDITRAEIFGPVITITTFSTEESATSFANSSEYSLMASLWTRDLHRAMRVAPQIRSGSVQINGSTIHSEPAFGLAGLGGASGYGRFNVDSVESFTDMRTIAFHGPDAKFPMM